MNKGIIAAFSAYVIWGFLPIYWKWLESVSPIEILAHRILWSFILLVVIQSIFKDWGWLRPALRDRRSVILFTCAAVLITANWFIYIWAVNSNHVLETSLGYFINPLVVILFGVVFLREHLQLYQWAAVGLAAAGVIYLTIQHGQVPWVSILLAMTFGLYGLLKKIGALTSLRGVTMETATMSIPALVFLLTMEASGKAAFGHQSLIVNILLIMAGLITSLPLVLFGYGAQRIPLYMLGLAQYIAPTITFILSLTAFGEPFEASWLPGYVLVWIALAIYTTGELVAWRRRVALRPLSQ